MPPTGHTPITAIRTCLQHYADFRGRAPLSEFWYWLLMVWGVCIVLLTLMGDPELNPDSIWEYWLRVFQLATLLPTLAVTVRRLRDAGSSIWHLLWVFFPIIGWRVLLVHLCMPSHQPKESAE